MDAVGKISGWIGLPKYEAQIPRLQRLAALWSSLTLILPFLAASLLPFGKDLGPNHPENNRGTTIVSYPEVSPESSAATAFITYLLRLAISVLGAVGFLIVFILVVLLVQKLGMRAH